MGRTCLVWVQTQGSILPQGATCLRATKPRLEPTGCNRSPPLSPLCHSLRSATRGLLTMRSPVTMTNSLLHPTRENEHQPISIQLSGNKIQLLKSVFLNVAKRVDLKFPPQEKSVIMCEVNHVNKSFCGYQL